MTKTSRLLLTLALLGVIAPVPLLFGAATDAEAANGVVSEGGIQFSKKELAVVDPENPDTIVEPGEPQQAGQYLRLELVPTLDFGMNTISDQNQVYFTKAQLFHDTTPARANYVQVTDAREQGAGWGLYLKQEYQFTSKSIERATLKGGVLSFDKLWLNTASDAAAPMIQQQTLSLQPETTYQLLHADDEQGRGTWLLSFGASEGNPYGQPNTLLPQLDDKGQQVNDQKYQKGSYLNQAIRLAVPGKAEKLEAFYQTELTWTLSELP